MSSKILYNVTIKIDSTLHTEWLVWMQRVHIPEVLETGCFESYKMTKILGDEDEHGVGFAIQYVCENLQKFNEYKEKYAKSLQQSHSDRYNGKYVAFRTLMEVVAEG